MSSFLEAAVPNLVEETIRRVFDAIENSRLASQRERVIQDIVDEEITDAVFAPPAFTDIPPSFTPRPISARAAFMAKRVRTDALTGGTGDVNPEYSYFSLDIPQNQATNLLASSTFQFPIQQFNLPGGAASYVPIIELLRTSLLIDGFSEMQEQFCTQVSKWWNVRCSMGGADNPGNSILMNTKSNRTFFEVTGKKGAASTASTYVFPLIGVQGAGNSTHSTAGNAADCTFDMNHIDDNGHGILLFGNQVTVGFVTQVDIGGNSLRLTFCFYYRIKNVTLQQYLAGQAALGGTLAVN